MSRLTGDISGIQQLECLVEALVGFLDAHPVGSRGSEQSNWFGRQVRASAEEVRNGDAHGLRRFLSLHGGMGSLNDTCTTR